VRGAVILNCAGPWVDDVLAMARSSEAHPRLRRSEGIHIITAPIINDRCAVSAITPEGRHCFLIPWRGHTLIGTTDKPYAGHPDDYRVTRRSIEDLIAAVNASFDGLSLTPTDVRHCYGGLRPLVETQTAETYKSSRKYEIHDHCRDGLDNLLSVEGGKWTTSRHLAEKVIDRVREKTLLPIPPSISERRYLEGSAIRNMDAFLHRTIAANRDFAEDTVAYLGQIYGTDIHALLELARQDKSLAEPMNTQGDILAQAVYAARHEMAYTLKDIVLHRTGIATTGSPGEAILRRVAEAVAPDLDWDENRIQEEVDKTTALLKIPED
jgi:glycerol-3-phosphate dehydrogenase